MSFAGFGNSLGFGWDFKLNSYTFKINKGGKAREMLDFDCWTGECQVRQPLAAPGRLTVCCIWVIIIRYHSDDRIFRLGDELVS